MSEIVFSEPLDIAYDECDFIEVCERFWREFSVALAVTKIDTGNGWPEVRLVGTRYHVARALITAWVSGDDESDRELFDAVMPR